MCSLTPSLAVTVCLLCSHYAGSVNYEGVGLIEKNRDFLPEIIEGAVADSQSLLIGRFFGATIAAPRGSQAGFGRRASKQKSISRISRRMSRVQQKANAKKPSVGALFTRSLVLLMTKMNPCQPHFVRCIKPNSAAVAKQYDDEYVLKQLRYTGMLETVRVRREGYASRPTFAEFLERFGVLAHGLQAKVAPTAANCTAVLSKVRA